MFPQILPIADADEDLLFARITDLAERNSKIETKFARVSPAPLQVDTAADRVLAKQVGLEVNACLNRIKLIAGVRDALDKQIRAIGRGDYARRLLLFGQSEFRLGHLGSLCAQNARTEREENEAGQDDFHLPVLRDFPKNRVLAGRRYHTGDQTAGRPVEHDPRCRNSKGSKSCSHRAVPAENAEPINRKSEFRSSNLLGLGGNNDTSDFTGGAIFSGPGKRRLRAAAKFAAGTSVENPAHLGAANQQLAAGANDHASGTGC